MQQYAVVFFLKTNTEKIQGFREKYDPQYKVIPPHITLVSPFAGIEESKIIEHVHAVTKEIPAFQIHIQGLHTSLDNYLFLLVQEGKEELSNLRKTLYSRVLEKFLPHEFQFIPHITLGEAIENAQTAAKKLQIDFWCRVDSVSIINGDGIAPAQTIQTVYFLS